METLVSPELGQDSTQEGDSGGNHGSQRELQFELVGFGADAVPYREAWELQRSVHAQVVAGDRPDTVLLLEHPAVYTAGRRTEPQERPQDGTEVIDVDRGGKITWHGPGQLVGYPIVRLAQPVDVVEYVRRLERMLMEVCARVGVQAVQVPGRSGVWMPATGEAEPGAHGLARLERKLAAVGIRVAQGVTMHGFSLNCDPDLGVYGTFIPCGITDAGVTSLSAERAVDPTVHRLRRVSVADVLPPVLQGLRNTDLGGHRA